MDEIIIFQHHFLLLIDEPLILEVENFFFLTNCQIKLFIYFHKNPNIIHSKILPIMHEINKKIGTYLLGLICTLSFACIFGINS